MYILMYVMVQYVSDSNNSSDYSNEVHKWSWGVGCKPLKNLKKRYQVISPSACDRRLEVPIMCKIRNGFAWFFPINQCEFHSSNVARCMSDDASRFLLVNYPSLFFVKSAILWSSHYFCWFSPPFLLISTLVKSTFNHNYVGLIISMFVG